MLIIWTAIETIKFNDFYLLYIGIRLFTMHPQSFLKCLFWWWHDTDFSDPENYLLKWLLTLGVLQYGTSSLWCTYFLSIEGGVWNIINVINKKKSPVDNKTAVKLVNFSGYALPQGIYVLMILGTFFLFCTWIVIYYSPAPKERGYVDIFKKNR